MKDQNDLKEYLSGDIHAFERIVSRHEKSLLRFTTSFLGDSEISQDIVQECFLKLIKKSNELRHLKSLSAWLHTVCRNASIDFIRKEARMRKTYSKVALCAENDSPGTTTVQAEKEESRDVLVRELRRLPQNQQEVLILKVQQEKSYKEISEITGLTQGNIGYLVHHGLRNLSARLKAAGSI